MFFGNLYNHFEQQIFNELESENNQVVNQLRHFGEIKDKIEFENKSSTTDPYSLIAQGYTWCGTCCRGMK